jgi:hypothetical protein
MVKHVLAIAFLTLMTPVFSNTGRNMESELILGFNRINYWYERQKVQPEIELGDSLVNANQDFQNMLLRHTKDASTLTADFKTLKKCGVKIATSEDGLFRIYSWDTELGGSMHIYYNVYQYKSGGKVYSRVISDGKFEAGRWFSSIYSQHVSDKTYYLGIAHSIYSSKDSSQEIRVFNISDATLDEQAKLIKTKAGLTNRLRVEYDFFSVYRRPERPVKLITYDKNSKAIALPLVDEKYQVTDKFITYKFNGDYFVRK